MMNTAAKYRLYGSSLDELKGLCEELGLSRFAHKQIARWLYTRFVDDIDQMTDLSKEARQRLKEVAVLGTTPPLKVSVSVDGTKKYLFATSQGEYIESAYIPDRERATLCVSSQAGCRMGCKFCASGLDGLVRNLQAGEIMGQVIVANKYRKFESEGIGFLTRFYYPYQDTLDAEYLYYVPSEKYEDCCTVEICGIYKENNNWKTG